MGSGSHKGSLLFLYKSWPCPLFIPFCLYIATMKHNSNTMKDVLEYIEKRVEGEEWNKNYHFDKIQKATKALQVWKEKVGMRNEIDESLIDHLRKDIDYHKGRLQACLFELDVLYTARDAKHNKYHQMIAAR